MPRPPQRTSRDVYRGVFVLLDASDGELLRFALRVGEEWMHRVERIGPHAAHEILVLLDAFLREYELTPERVEKFFVVEGPGAYSGLRTALSIANALTLAFGVTVQGVTLNDVPFLLAQGTLPRERIHFLTPRYGKPPHTTRRRAVLRL